MIRRHMTFYGWVQGVGFRYRARHAAELYGCTGWVRNEWDGSVTMEIQGTEENIDRVILAIEAGRYVKIENMDSRTIALFVPMLVLVPLMVYGINGAKGFWDSYWQMLAILMISGLFDRIFIDWWWVGHTKAWIIPGTEDLMPYIYGKTLARKWLGTVVGFPILAAILAGVMQRIQ